MATGKKKEKKILIVEDEKPMGRALELKLSHEGFAVTNTSDGDMAIDALKSATFDLILCDLVMPKVDGFGVLEEVKKQTIKTPVIILTNLSQEEDRKKVLALGAKDFFVKSNTPIADIVAYVKDFLT